MKSILVKLPNWMGDILFSYDLLYTLTSRFERMSVMTSTDHQELFDVFPLPKTEVIAYPPEHWPNFNRETIGKIQEFRADLTLVLPNSFGSALTLRYAGARNLVGYNTEHRAILLNKSMQPPSARIHQTQYFLTLLKLFDLIPDSYPIKNPQIKKPRVIIHPGASKIPRAWHLDRFYEVAERLKEEGLEVIFVSGEKISVDPYPLFVRPRFKEFCDLLRESVIFIGNDSGPLHLAQQCGTPVVGIYGPGDPLVTGPRAITSYRVIYHAFPCSPCRQKFFEECDPSPNKKPYCIETISVDEVLKASRDLIKETQSAVAVLYERI